MTWACDICTFENENDTFLACAACGSERSTTIEWDPFGHRSPSPDIREAAPSVPRKPTRAAPRLAPPQSPIHDTTGQTHAIVGGKNGSSEKTAPSDPLKPVLRELVETERIYVKELEAVCSVFLEPLRCRAQEADTPILSESEVNSIFGNIVDIKLLNSGLLTAFDKALKETADADTETQVEALCKAFLKYAPHMKMYAAYAIQYDTAQGKLKKFESGNFRFVEFINIAGGMNEVTMNQPLSSFLIKPIQRICKYPLFFHQMLKAVDEASHLHALLKKALDAAGEVASKINADKLRAEQALRAFEVAKRLEHLSDVILEPGRRYVGEWKCFMSEGNNSLTMKRRSIAKTIITTEKKARSCFLFNDVLIVTKELGSGNKQRYELKLWISLNQLQFSGVNMNDPRTASAREGTSSAGRGAQQENGVPPSDNGKAKNGDQDRAVKAKLFQLPLDLLHVASSDRQKTQTYRDRQQQAQASQIHQIAARRPSLFKKKTGAASTTETPSNDTVITAYTMWFRSGAERARVALLIEKALQAFGERQVSPQSKTSFGHVASPSSPTAENSDGGATGRAYFASSEESLPSTAPAESPTHGKQQPQQPIRRARSMDSGMDSDSKQRRPSRTTATMTQTPVTASQAVYALDPLHSSNSPPKPQAAERASSAGVVSSTDAHRRASLRDKPRPPPPALPKVVVVVPPVVPLSHLPPVMSAKQAATAPAVNQPHLNGGPLLATSKPQSVLNLPLQTPLKADGDHLISKWFGE